MFIDVSRPKLNFRLYIDISNNNDDDCCLPFSVVEICQTFYVILLHSKNSKTIRSTQGSNNIYKRKLITRYKVQGTRYKVQGTRYKLWETEIHIVKQYRATPYTSTGRSPTEMMPNGRNYRTRLPVKQPI